MSDQAMSACFEGHGYRVGGKAIFVGELPGRKSVCLYEQDGSVIRTLAFFKTHKQAQTALDLLDGLARASHSPPHEESNR